MFGDPRKSEEGFSYDRPSESHPTQSDRREEKRLRKHDDNEIAQSREKFISEGKTRN
jgi:hypothetical protein